MAGEVGGVRVASRREGRRGVLEEPGSAVGIPVLDETIDPGVRSLVVEDVEEDGNADLRSGATQGAGVSSWTTRDIGRSPVRFMPSSSAFIGSGPFFDIAAMSSSVIALPAM